MTTRKSETLGIPNTLNGLIQKITTRAEDLKNPSLEDWMDEIRGYLSVKKLLVQTIDFEKPETIRAVQKSLAFLEARLDRIMVLQHDAKRVLQIIATVETQLIGAMVRVNALPSKATAPMQQRCLAAAVPKLISVKTSWETLELVCQQAQRRIASAKESIKLQSQLDDNLRWAQYRNPG